MFFPTGFALVCLYKHRTVSQSSTSPIYCLAIPTLLVFPNPSLRAITQALRSCFGAYVSAISKTPTSRPLPSGFFHELFTFNKKAISVERRLRIASAFAFSLAYQTLMHVHSSFLDFAREE